MKTERKSLRVNRTKVTFNHWKVTLSYQRSNFESPTAHAFHTILVDFNILVLCDECSCDWTSVDSSGVFGFTGPDSHLKDLKMHQPSRLLFFLFFFVWVKGGYEVV